MILLSSLGSIAVSVRIVFLSDSGRCSNCSKTLSEEASFRLVSTCIFMVNGGTECSEVFERFGVDDLTSSTIQNDIYCKRYRVLSIFMFMEQRSCSIIELPVGAYIRGYMLRKGSRVSQRGIPGQQASICPAISPQDPAQDERG